MNCFKCIWASTLLLYSINILIDILGNRYVVRCVSTPYSPEWLAVQLISWADYMLQTLGSYIISNLEMTIASLIIIDIFQLSTQIGNNFLG